MRQLKKNSPAKSVTQVLAPKKTVQFQHKQTDQNYIDDICS